MDRNVRHSNSNTSGHDPVDTELETKNTWHRPDPSFTYLLSFFLLLTSLAWGLAYADGFARTLRIMFVTVFIHFLLLSLLVATLFYFLVGRLLGPGVKGLPGRRRQGLFNVEEGGGTDSLEFGYCWDVAIRAFVPVWVFLYFAQFLLMPVIASKYWYASPQPCIRSHSNMLPGSRYSWATHSI